MQDDTHDQNQGLETPDTAPSRGRVIGIAILTYALFACASYFLFYQPGESIEQAARQQDIAATERANVGPYNKALYYAPTNSQRLQSQQITFANLETAASPIELDNLIEQQPEIDIIFVDPSQLATGNPAWLRQKYDDGLIIVGLNISHQIFGKWLELSPTKENLAADLTNGSAIWVTIYYQDESGSYEITDSYDQLEAMLDRVHDIR